MLSQLELSRFQKPMQLQFLAFSLQLKKDYENKFYQKSIKNWSFIDKTRRFND